MAGNQLQLLTAAGLQVAEPSFLVRERGVDGLDAGDVFADRRDLVGTRAAEVAVVGEHAACLRQIALVQQQAQRLGAPDCVCGAQLPGEAGALGLEQRLLGIAVALQGGAVLAAPRQFGLQARELAAAGDQCQLGGLQAARQAVALGSIAADLQRHGLDARAYGLEFRLGLALGSRSGSRQRGQQRQQRQQGGQDRVG